MCERSGARSVELDSGERKRERGAWLRKGIVRATMAVRMPRPNSRNGEECIVPGSVSGEERAVYVELEKELHGRIKGPAIHVGPFG